MKRRWTPDQLPYSETRRGARGGTGNPQIARQSRSAVDVARAAVDKLGYADFLKRLNIPSADATDFAAKLSGELPTGHEKQIAATLLDSIKRLDENGLTS